MKTKKIEIIGSGCAKCKKLFELTKEVVGELGLNDNVLYSNDINKIVTMGVMSSPVLTIDDKPVLVGILPDKEKLKEIISQNQKFESKPSSGCSCGGKC